MAIQDFTAGQVLTAAQMDSLQANDYNQTVSTKTANYTLVATDKGTRVVMDAAGATTITVNTSLFSAGDTVVLQNIGAGVCTVTAGTATVSSAGPLAIPQYGSGTLYFTSAGVSIYFPSAVTAAAVSSGLTLISSTTIGSAVASVSVTGCFSATYDNYKILLSGGESSASNVTLSMQLGATTTGYSNVIFYVDFATLTTPQSDGTNNGSSWAQVGAGATNGLHLDIDLLAPFLSKRTTFSGGSSTFSNALGGAVNGIQNSTTSFTDFTLTPSSGTLTGGVIRVYGYSNS